MLAVSTLDPTVQGILFLVAVIFFALAAWGVVTRVNLIAAGLAVATFVFAWNAFAASG